MAIRYVHPATQETTTKEPWYWVAIYDDGTQLEQFEVSHEHAIFHRSGEIDAEKLIELQLRHNTYPPITIAVPKGAKPVHLYRHRWVNEEVITETGEHLNRQWRTKIWIIGFKRDGHYCLVFVDDNNHTLVSDDYDTFLDKALPEGVS